MAHFAKLDENNVVVDVIKVDNIDTGELDFPESETMGRVYLASIVKLPGKWYQTSYNNNFRKRFARIGHLYNKDIDAFIAPQPFPSWTLDAGLADWVPPVAHPTTVSSGMECYWDEASTTWKERPLYSTNE
jgi:hypothetical protein